LGLPIAPLFHKGFRRITGVNEPICHIFVTSAFLSTPRSARRRPQQRRLAPGTRSRSDRR